MTQAGDLDRRITIQRATSSSNEFNEPIQVWSDVATVWAKRRDASDSQKIEFLAAGQVGAFRLSRFTIRNTRVTRSVTPSDRLVHEGKTWEIKGVKETTEDNRRQFLEITAAMDAD